MDSHADAAQTGKRGRGRPKGSGKRPADVPAKGAEKLGDLIAFVFQWLSEMLADILQMPELAFVEIETDDGEKIAEADVLAKYPARYALKTALGRQAAKLAADDDLLKTLVILANYSLRVTPAIVRKYNDVTTSRPARQIGRGDTGQPQDAGNSGPAVADSAERGQRAAGSLRWVPGVPIPGGSRPPAFGPSANGAYGSVPPGN